MLAVLNVKAVQHFLSPVLIPGTQGRAGDATSHVWLCLRVLHGPVCPGLSHQRAPPKGTGGYLLHLSA